MSIILSSNGVLLEEHRNYIKEFYKEEIKDLKVCLIENASNIFRKESEYEMNVVKHRDIIKEQGFKYELEDLRVSEDFEYRFNKYDIIWLSSGNLYYLNWIVNKTKFNKILKDHLENKKILICTGSATMLMSENIKYYDYLYNETLPITPIYKGLGFIEENAIPFWNSEYQVILKEIKNEYEKINRKTIVLQDNESIVIEKI